MPEFDVDGETKAIRVGKFRLAFVWSNDRWEHRLEQGDPGSILAASLESDPNRDDPARVVSPAYQQLQFQRIGSTYQALLVGQSGPHHFSAVFGLEAQGTGVSILVDIADRCRSPVEALGATYSVDAGSGDLVDAHPGRAQWSLELGRLEFASISPAQVCLAEAGRRLTQIQALAGLAPGAATHRLLYTWKWEPVV